jgi:acetylornithine deacetylase/succinyl-diaminopimelate desuccinylase-like protein
MMSAGHAPNALPQLAKANVNCRILPGHSAEQIRLELVRIFADSKIRVRYVDDAGKVYDRTPEKNAFPPVMPPDEVLKPLARIADEMWSGVPVIPDMETGASDSIYTVAAGLPSYGISGVAIDQDDVRAHGKDERVRISSYYDGLAFYYRYLKALTSPKGQAK